MVKNSEHPTLTKKEINYLTDEERCELKHFLPAYLTAEHWDNKLVDAALTNIEHNAVVDVLDSFD